MLSLLHFYHVIFLCLFINTCSTQLTLKSQCLTFQKVKENITSSCEVRRINSTETTSSECLTCKINEIIILQKNNCIKHFTCVDLDFLNNTVFQYMLRNGHRIITNLFKISNQSEKSLFNITLRTCEHKNIDKSYIETFLGNTSKPYHSLHISILKHKQSKINKDLSKVNINQFRIQIACDNNKGMIRYNITNQSMVYKKDDACEVRTTTKSTKLVVNHTNKIVQSPLIMNTKSKNENKTEEITTTENINQGISETTQKESSEHENHTVSSIQENTVEFSTNTNIQQSTPATEQILTSPELPSTPENVIIIPTEEVYATTTTNLISSTGIEDNAQPAVIQVSTLTIIPIATTTNLQSSTVSTKRSKNLLLLILLPVLLLLAIGVAGMITQTILKNRRLHKPVEIIRENSTDMTPVSNSNISSNSNIQSAVSPSNKSATYLTPTVSPRNKPVFASDWNRHFMRTMDKDF